MAREIRNINKNRVFQYLMQYKRDSKPGIAKNLGLSIPTVMQLTKELEVEGLIQDDGGLESTGGRKAKALTPNWDCKYAAGIEITSGQAGFLLTDLSGRILCYERKPLGYHSDTFYYGKLGELFRVFIHRNVIHEEKLLGVGIAVPGIIDEKENRVIDSDISEFVKMRELYFQKYLKYPCHLLNAASAAANAEKRKTEDTGEALVYLDLGNSIQAGIAVKARETYGYEIEKWKKNNLGHMILHPQGELCSCGKKGCANIYCSAERLKKQAEGSLEVFFRELEQGKEQAQLLWRGYLDDLLLLVDSIGMVLNCEIVLGGETGEFIAPYLQEIREKIKENQYLRGDAGRLRMARYLEEGPALGAALYFIDRYISDI